LDEQRANLPENLRSLAQGVLEGGPRLVEQFGDLSGRNLRAGKIRVHGDYHLGQVLRVRQDVVILDFEGEPARTLPERRAKTSPLKDVAGMLRSFEYAAFAALFAFTKDRPEDQERLEKWATVWRQWTGAAFLRAYRETVGSADFLPGEMADLDMLLRFFLLDKALYELLYELNHRPTWARIPLTGVLQLLSSTA
jgi:maltose alpha-D-glucosyltransferase/alpha-amylase